MPLPAQVHRVVGLLCLACCACSQCPEGSTPMEKIKQTQSKDSSSGLVNLVASSDGLKLLTTTRDGYFVVWNSRNLKELSRAHGAPTPPLGMAWTTDNQWVAVTRGGSIAWDARRGKELFRHPLDLDLGVGAIDPNGSAAFGAAGPGAMVMIEPKTGKRKTLPPELGHEAVAAAFSPNQNHLALAVNSGNSDNVIIVDTNEMKKKTVIEHNQGRLSQVVYAQSGMMVATAGQDNEVRLWDSQSGSPRCSLKTALPVVGPIAFSGDTQRVAISSSTHDRAGNTFKADEKPCPWGVSKGSMIQVFDVQSAKEVSRSSLQSALCNALLFTHNANGLFSADEDGTLSFWKLPLSPFVPLPNRISSTANEA